MTAVCPTRSRPINRDNATGVWRPLATDQRHPGGRERRQSGDGGRLLVAAVSEHPALSRIYVRRQQRYGGADPHACVVLREGRHSYRWKRTAALGPILMGWAGSR